MKDLISREAAVSICDSAIDLWNGQLGAGALIAVRDAIEALPSVERHGEWIQKSTGGESFYTCSRCGFIAWEHEDTNYCPNCGARME